MSAGRHFVVERLNWRPCYGPADQAKGRAKKKQVARALLPGVKRYKLRDWFGWWAKLADGLTAEQRAAVWALLDRLKFYGVIKAEMD